MYRLHSVRYSILLAAIVVLSAVGAAGQTDGGRGGGAVNVDIATSAVNNAGLRFRENRGQVIDTRGEHRSDILYTAGGGGVHVYLRRDAISYVFARWTPDSTPPRSDAPGMDPLAREPASGRLDRYRMDMQLIGANANATVIAEDITADYANYYLAHCPDGITRVPSYRRVIYRDIYPNIDLVLHTVDHRMKYDFVVRPGGRVEDIAWRYVGSDGASLGKDGSLRVTAPLGQLQEAAPYASQNDRQVACMFRRDGDRFGYQAPEYDRRAALVIDPTVEWATYFGGDSDLTNFTISDGGITTDATGDVAAISIANDDIFPATAGAMQTTFNPLVDLFLLKIGAGGNLIWGTYWGGTGLETGWSIAADSAGNYAVLGGTRSTDFPVGPGAARPFNAGYLDLVVGVLDRNGMRRWATYLGGSLTEISGSVMVDQRGNVIVASSSGSPDFPTSSPTQAALAGGYDATFTKFSSTGTMLWSTYFGGDSNDFCWRAHISPDGGFVATGQTESFTELPLYGASYQRYLRGNIHDAFLARFDGNGVPQWSTYYGNNGNSAGYGVTVDTSGNVIMVGITDGPGSPTNAGSFQADPAGGSDCFIAKFDSIGGHIWSTYYGGSGNEWATGVAIDGLTGILVTGPTTSTNFPVTPDAYRRNRSGPSDGFLVLMNAHCAQVWATYYGGGADDTPIDIAASVGNAYVLGFTNSMDLPERAKGFQQTRNRVNDMFVVKFTGFCPYATPAIDRTGTVTLCNGDSVVLTASPGFTNYRWSPGNETTRKITVKRAGAYTVAARDAGGCVSASGPVQVRVNTALVPSITPAGPITICDGDSVLLSARMTGIRRYRWSNNDSLDQVWVRKAGDYTVVGTDTNGCRGTSAAVTIRVNPRPSRPLLSPLDTVWVCPDSILRLDAGAGQTGYRWTPGGSGLPSIAARDSGLYYVDVVNALGCTIRSDSVMVMFYPRVPVRLVVTGPLQFCGGDSVILEIPPGAFTGPRWSNGATTSRLVVRTSGAYYATVTDTNGCRVRSDTLRVLVTPLLRADIAGPASVCRDAVSTYSTGAAGTLRYTWSLTGAGAIQGAADAKSITVRWGATGNGTLRLTVTDTATGCTATGTRDVTIGTTLKPVVAPGGPITICAGDSVELDAGAGYTSYAWSNGAISQTIWVKDSMGYTVAVADASGCRGTSDTVRARVEAPPSPVIDGAAKVCRSTQTGYGVRDISGVDYQWQTTGGVITGGQGTSAITVMWGAGPAGTIDVTMTSAGGCKGSMRLSVEIGTQLKPTIMPSGNVGLCIGDSIELDAGGGYASYLWSSGETSRRIMVRAAGLFAVTVMDASGCGGTSDTARVILNPPPTVAIAPPGPITLRQGDSIVLDAGSGYAAYRWSTGETTRRIAVKDSGHYAVHAIDGNGCGGDAGVTVVLGETSAGAVIALGDVQATPGDRVELPLRLVSSVDLAESGITGYEARIRYRASLLIPTGATPPGALDGSDRLLTVSGALPAGMESGDLARLEFIAALADTDRGVVKLESVTWRGSGGGAIAAANVLHDGAFELVGLCTNGGARLVRAGGEEGLKAVVPNPASGTIRIVYDLVEIGQCRLAITDLLGREVGEVFKGDRVSGEYEAVYETRPLPVGLYVIVLQTPTGRVGTMLRVVR